MVLLITMGCVAEIVIGPTVPDITISAAPVAARQIEKCVIVPLPALGVGNVMLDVGEILPPLDAVHPPADRGIAMPPTYPVYATSLVDPLPASPGSAV